MLSCSEEFSVIMVNDINGSAKFDPKRKMRPKLTSKHELRMNARVVSCKHIMSVLSWKENGLSIKLQWQGSCFHDAVSAEKRNIFFFRIIVRKIFYFGQQNTFLCRLTSFRYITRSGPAADINLCEHAYIWYSCPFIKAFYYQNFYYNLRKASPGHLNVMVLRAVWDRVGNNVFFFGGAHSMKCFSVTMTDFCDALEAQVLFQVIQIIL